MAQNVIHVRSTRAKVRQAIQKAVEIASGTATGAQDAANALQARIGMTALAHIKHAFVVKARGGTDESGLSWPKLSPKTIAYSRRHPGVLWPGSKRAPFAPSWMLTEKQRNRWWEVYRRGLAQTNGDKERAAKFAWSVLKSEGAKTLLGQYGSTPVEILRDTGLLLNSLSPGIIGAVENQVFNIGPGYVIVGTNRKWAKQHHEGIPGRLPQRRLWPEPSQWPDSWYQDIAEQAKQGLIDILISVLRGVA